MSFNFNPLLFLILLFCWPNMGLSQRELTRAQQAEFIQVYRDGDQLLDKKKYRKAQKSYERAISLKPKMAAAYRRLAVVHELLEEFELSADYFEKAIELNPKLSRTLYFQAGEMHIRTENYPKAKIRLKEYQQFLAYPPETFENGLQELSTEVYFNTKLDLYIANSTFSAHKTDFTNIKISNLGAKINSKLDESFPYIANNESWMFYTRNVPQYGLEDQLRYSTAESKGWAKSQALLDKKLRAQFNQGMGKISRDEKVMFFPGCNGEEILGGCDILKAAMRKDEILSIGKLGKAVNSEYWESQPSINCEGKSLYFVSDRPGGYGGTDIWVSHLQEDGSWTQAINLGDRVNTSGDEESPFIADDNVTLFFASNGHPGYGDMDIFITRNSEEGEWSKPQNMGKPVNSPEREISFFMTARGNKGYISSERKGGYGGLDIYEVTFPKKKDFEEIAYIKGRVLDAVTKEPVESIVYLGEKGNYVTDKDGRFFTCHPVLSQLNVLVSERKYYDFENSFSLENWNEDGFVEIDIYLRPLNQSIEIASLDKKVFPKSANREPEKIDVKAIKVKKEKLPTEEVYSTGDVYFYFDSYTLTQEARYNIDRIIEDIDKDQLALIVIEGFADQIGTDDYNQRLSEKRAEEVANYFKSKGQTNLRIKYKGYGETRTSFIYSKNRKVEIVVYYKI